MVSMLVILMLLVTLHETTSSAPCTINWKLGMTDQSVTVPSGGSVVFNWVGHHNVAELKSPTQFTSCDMSSAVELSKEVDHGSHSHRRLGGSEEEKTGTYTFEVGTTAGEKYLICSVDGHCKNGQKLLVVVSNSTDTAYDCPEYIAENGGNRDRIHSVSFLLMVVICVWPFLIHAQQNTCVHEFGTNLKNHYSRSH
jgi:hypothetical protein